MSSNNTAPKTLLSIGLNIDQLLDSLEKATIAKSQGLDKADLIEQQHRFDLWAINIGLRQKGHASLDYRFRDALEFHQYCLTLLEGLQRALETLHSELLDAAGDLNEDSPSSQSEEVDTFSDEGSLDSYDDQTTSEAAFSSIVDCIDRLFRLSMKVRNPAMRIGLSKGYTFSKIDEDTDLDLFDCFADYKIDQEHIENVLKGYNPRQSWVELSDSYLIARLTKANIQRRRQFAYWSRHRLNLTYRDQKAKVVKQQSKPTTATYLDPTKVDLNDAHSAMSTISMNIPESPNSSRDAIIFPDPPEKYAAQEGLKEFECPYCATICSRRLLNRPEWKAHILKDLRPYICTHEECETSSQLYDSFGDWFNHEFTHYHKKSNSDLQQHRECPFCFEVLSTLELAARHIAIHLIRIALFALPRSTGIEVEQDGRSAASNEIAAPSEWTGSQGLNLTASDSMSFDDQSMRARSRASSIAHDDDDDEYKMKQNPSHRSQKPMEETVAAAFAHEDPRNPVPPELIAQISANVIKQLKTYGVGSTSPEPSEKLRDHTSIVHEDEYRSKQNPSHRSQQSMAETITSAFPHEDPRNPVPPELIAQITKNVINQLKSTVTDRTSAELSENTRRQSPPREKWPDIPAETPERVSNRPAIHRPRARENFLEDRLPPLREGVAALKKVERQGIPSDARWTKIDRKLVNPEALEAGNERYEEKENYVIVLRVLTKDMIEEYALKTAEIRAKRATSRKDSFSHA